MPNQVIFGTRFIGPGLLLAGLIFCAMASAQVQSPNLFSNPALHATVHPFSFAGQHNRKRGPSMP